jgi:arylsulfatase A-like enzyme
MMILIVGSSCGSDPDLPVRIILITIDTLRYDGLETGSTRPSLMPETQAIAQTGMVFERHYAASSSTQPTHATILTGLHPWQHGVSRNGLVLDDEIPTVAERMKTAGYATAAVVASFPLHHTFGFDQGFDVYDDTFTEQGVETWQKTEVPEGRFRSQATTVTAKAVDLIRHFSEGSQFLWFHYFDPHSPYGDLAEGATYRLTDLRRKMKQPTQSMDAVAELPILRQAYDRDLKALDESLDVLFEEIRAANHRFETHVIVVSDHGESFGEHGSIGHGMRLTEEQIHVPCFILSPRTGAITVDIPTGSADIAATVLSLAGLSKYAPTGLDLTRPIDRKGSVLGMRRTFTTQPREIRTDGLYHDLEDFQFFLVDGETIFRGDRSRVTAEGPITVGQSDLDRAARLFDSFERELRARNPVELSDSETTTALEALGYVD